MFFNSSISCLLNIKIRLSCIDGIGIVILKLAQAYFVYKIGYQCLTGMSNKETTFNFIGMFPIPLVVSVFIKITVMKAHKKWMPLMQKCQWFHN